MNNQRISKRLLEIEQRITSVQTESTLEDEYRAWMRNHPLEDSSDFNFDKWMDDMPEKFSTLFSMSVLTTFSWLRLTYK